MFPACKIRWLLVAAIVAGTAASTYQIDSRFLIFTVSGLRREKIPASEFASIRAEPAFFGPAYSSFQMARKYASQPNVRVASIGWQNT
jgi:hypothetical protein